MYTRNNWRNRSTRYWPAREGELELELELEEEIARGSIEYVKWIQVSLNKLMGLKLEVDGVVGPITRSAIRSFQARSGLMTDGIVGPLTEAAMIKAGASVPPGAAGPGTGVAPPPSPPPNLTGLAERLVAVANQEWERWKQGATKETASSMQPVLLDYWVNGAGTRWGYDNKLAWSAAFISWVVKKAGGGDSFRYSGAHSTYTYYAKKNRVENNSNPFKAYRVTEVKPAPGDILVQNRGSSRYTYDNLKPDVPGTHGDIVVAVTGQTVYVIGGNLSNSVSKNKYTLGSNGFLNSAAHFAIIKTGG